MAGLLSEGHLSGIIEQRYQHKITDNTEQGVLNDVKEKASAIFFALEQELGNVLSFEGYFDLIQMHLDSGKKEKAESSIVRAEDSLQKAENLSRIGKLAIKVGGNGSQEQAKLQSYIDKVDTNVEDWKAKIQGFKDQLAQP